MGGTERAANEEPPPSIKESKVLKFARAKGLDAKSTRELEELIAEEGKEAEEEKEHKGHHEGAMPFYSMPEVLQHNGEEQAEVHIGWADIYLDLILVGVAFNGGLLLKHAFYLCVPAGEHGEHGGEEHGAAEHHGPLHAKPVHAEFALAPAHVNTFSYPEAPEFQVHAATTAPAPHRHTHALPTTALVARPLTPRPASSPRSTQSTRPTPSSPTRCPIRPATSTASCASCASSRGTSITSTLRASG